MTEEQLERAKELQDQISQAQFLYKIVQNSIEINEMQLSTSSLDERRRNVEVSNVFSKYFDFKSLKASWLAKIKNELEALQEEFDEL